MLDAIETKASVHGKKYSAYITYDRDLTKTSFTPYQDGLHEPAHARAAAVGMIAEIKRRGNEIVGFDICGMPNTDGVSKVGGKDKSDGLAEAFDDVKAFYAALQ